MRIQPALRSIGPVGCGPMFHRAGPVAGGAGRGAGRTAIAEGAQQPSMSFRSAKLIGHRRGQGHRVRVLGHGAHAAARSAAQSFDRTAADYDRLGELGENDRIRSWLVSVLPHGGRALDLGCGAGCHAVLLAGRFTHVDAVDISLPMIEIARAKRSRPNVAYRQADLLETTVSGDYDLVLSVMTLHHVPDLQAALAHIKRLLAPGGGRAGGPVPGGVRAAPVATGPSPAGPAPAAAARDGSPAPRREPRPARPGHRLGDLPAAHPQGVARSPRERPVLQPGGARPALCHLVPRLPDGAAGRCRRRADLGQHSFKARGDASLPLLRKRVLFTAQN